MSDWCSCDPLREAQEKAAKYDTLMERMGDTQSLTTLFEGDCETCAAYDTCKGCTDWEHQCEEVRAKWLLGVE